MTKERFEEIKMLWKQRPTSFVIELFNEIERLQAQVSKIGCDTSVSLFDYFLMKEDFKALQEKNDILTSEKAELIKCLKFYGDCGGYELGIESNVMVDEGDEARDLLKKMGIEI